MRLTLFVLDVDDFRPLAEVAAKQPGVDVARRGPYYEVSSEATIEIDRDSTGCRNAVWFSSVAAIRHGHVSRWDKTVLRPYVELFDKHVQGILRETAALKRGASLMLAVTHALTILEETQERSMEF